MHPRGGDILLVDDDPGLLRLMSIRLSAAGHDVRAVESGEAALQAASASRPDLVITDLKMGAMDGMELLDQLNTRWPGLPVLMLTAHGTIPDAVTATQQGAFSFLTKPVEKGELLDHVGRALRLSASKKNDRSWRSAIVTRSVVMEELLAQAHRVAATKSSILITGDSGTGKELLARGVHKASGRDGEFVAVNCGAIPEDLLESELFGHAKGAFTGAMADRMGLFHAASGGTLFLDEIGDMPLALQVKLLRVLQEQHVRPVGSDHTIDIDVRVLSATHRDLEAAMQENVFRQDLYYRLNVVELCMPTLSERRDDIPLLVVNRLEQLEDQVGKRKAFSPQAMELLVGADWPGNVRQLFNVVEKTAALSPTQIISARAVQNALGDSVGAVRPYAEARDEFTRNYLIQLLQISRGNVSKAARLAKRNRTDFYKLLSRHNVDAGSFKK